MVVTLGALLADVPHSRPVAITGLSSDDALVERLGLAPSELRGADRHRRRAAQRPARRPACRPRRLWASVPHYVAAAPNPKAALALVRKLEGLVGVTVDAEELERAAADYERQVSLAVQSDPDVQAFVERLERAAEEEERGDPTRSDLPSGDVIAREFQRFLRQRGPGPDGLSPAPRGPFAALAGRGPSPGSSTCEARRSMSPCSSQPPGMRSISP